MEKPFAALETCLTTHTKVRTCCPVYELLEYAFDDPGRKTRSGKMKGREQRDLNITYLGFLSTKTTTSEKVYRRRGYRCVTANSLLLLALESVQVISRSDVW